MIAVFTYHFLGKRHTVPVYTIDEFRELSAVLKDSVFREVKCYEVAPLDNWAETI